MYHYLDCSIKVLKIVEVNGLNLSQNLVTNGTTHYFVKIWLQEKDCANIGLVDQNSLNENCIQNLDNNT